MFDEKIWFKWKKKKKNEYIYKCKSCLKLMLKNKSCMMLMTQFI